LDERDVAAELPSAAVLLAAADEPPAVAPISAGVRNAIAPEPASGKKTLLITLLILGGLLLLLLMLALGGWWWYQQNSRREAVQAVPAETVPAQAEPPALPASAATAPIEVTSEPSDGTPTLDQQPTDEPAMAEKQAAEQEAAAAEARKQAAAREAAAEERKQAAAQEAAAAKERKRAAAQEAAIAAEQKRADERRRAEDERRRAEEERRAAEARTPPLNLDRSGSVQEAWLSSMRAELEVCKRENLFKSAICVERVRWKHCPGHWNAVEECRVQKELSGGTQ